MSESFRVNTAMQLLTAIVQ